MTREIHYRTISQNLCGVSRCAAHQSFSFLMQNDPIWFKFASIYFLRYLPHTCTKVQKWSKIRKNCMGEVHQKMTFEYFNLYRVLLHQKTWRSICWSPSNSPKKESSGAKQHLKGKSAVYYNTLLFKHLRGFDENWVFFIPYLDVLVSKNEIRSNTKNKLIIYQPRFFYFLGEMSCPIFIIFFHQVPGRGGR